MSHGPTPLLLLTSLVLGLSVSEAEATSTLPLKRNDSVFTSSDGVFVAGAHDPLCAAPPEPAPWSVDETLIVQGADLRDVADPPGFSDSSFGVELRSSDADPTVTDVLVAASAMYDGMSSNASTRIYRIDGSSGAVSSFASLDGANLTSFGIGDLAYNPTAGVVYASSLDDGLIYVVEIDPGGETGTLLDTYDPFLPAISHAAEPIAPLGERVAGLGWNDTEGRLYFGLWTQDFVDPGTSAPNRVYSLPVDSQGIPIDDLSAADMRHFDEVHLGGFPDPFTNPVFSIAFDETDGRMLLATRPVSVVAPGNVVATPGSGRVYEYVGGHGLWSDPMMVPPPAPSGNTFEIGPTGAFASGGAAYDAAEADSCNGSAHVIATADDLGGAINGLQLLPTSGGNLASSAAALTDVGPLGSLAVCTGCPLHLAASVPASSPWMRLVLLLSFAGCGARLARGFRHSRLRAP